MSRPAVKISHYHPEFDRVLEEAHIEICIFGSWTVVKHQQHACYGLNDKHVKSKPAKAECMREFQAFLMDLWRMNVKEKIRDYS
jgi:hypothetical protein